MNVTCSIISVCMEFVKTYLGRLDANAAEDTNWTAREVTSIFNVFFSSNHIKHIIIYFKISCIGNCTDVNECESPQACLYGECINSEGNYTCKCPPNYQLVPAGNACVGL